MMKKIKTCLVSMLFACGLISGISSYAQETQTEVLYQSDNALVFGVEDVYKDSVLQTLFEIRDVNKRATIGPGIVVATPNNKLIFTLSGYVKMTAAYDFDGVIDNSSFITSLISTQKNKGDNQALRFNASHSLLTFKTVYNSDNLGPIAGVLTANFAGPDNTFHLKDAYVTMVGFTLGYTTTTLLDAAAEPPTIDAQGPNALTFIRNTQIRYTYNPNSHWQMALALEQPNASATYSPLTEDIYQRVPDVPLYVQYSWIPGSHVRVSGLFRDMTYRDLVTEKNKDQFAWGVQLSGLAQISNFTLYWQGIYGEGINNYIQDLNGNGMDMVVNSDVPGELDKMPAYGWYAGLQYNFSPSVFCSATYSQVKQDPKSRLKTPGMYKFSQYIVGNVFWNVTPRCQLGVEYIHGTLEDMNDESGKANRAQAMVQFNF